MRRSVVSVAALVSSAALVICAVQGCGSSSDQSIFGPTGNGANGAGDDGGNLNGFNSGGGTDGGTGQQGCQNLQCQQVQCSGGGTTTVSGTVFDPAGANPLYNVIVYVPNGKVDPFTPGVTCDQCGAVASGSPVVSTLTDAAGHFTLQNVPAGQNIPLVIQLGRWRRQVTIPNVAACGETKLTDVNMTRLPRNKAEGDIPLMAISTGQADPFECLLLKMGIDPAEFTPNTGDGRVHFYHQNGTTMPGAAQGSALWSDVATLKKYDIVMLPCEGKPNAHAAGDPNVLEYANVGGRVFTTHYSYAWTQSIWPTTGAWDLDQEYLNNVTTQIDTSFPKGKAFADWLQNVGATTKYGNLDEIEARHDLDAVNAPPSQQWISVGGLPVGQTSSDGRVCKAATSVQHMTFNTPIDAKPDDAGNALQCGKVVFSDFHVSAKALNPNATYFPQTCVGGAMTAQEKALEFMLFDLSACIQQDTAPPQPPPPVVR